MKTISDLVRTACVAVLVVAFVAVSSLQQLAFAKAIDGTRSDLASTVSHSHAAAATSLQQSPCDDASAGNEEADRTSEKSPDGNDCKTVCCEISCVAFLMVVSAPVELVVASDSIHASYAADFHLGRSAFDFLRPPRA